MENHSTKKLLQANLFLMVILIIGVGILIYKSFSLGSAFTEVTKRPVRNVSVASTNGYLGVGDGDNYKTTYDHLSNRPIEPDSLRGFYIDSAGFNALMDTTG